MFDKCKHIKLSGGVNCFRQPVMSTVWELPNHNSYTEASSGLIESKDLKVKKSHLLWKVGNFFTTDTEYVKSQTRTCGYVTKSSVPINTADDLKRHHNTIIAKRSSGLLVSDPDYQLACSDGIGWHRIDAPSFSAVGYLRTYKGRIVGRYALIPIDEMHYIVLSYERLGVIADSDADFIERCNSFWDNINTFDTDLKPVQFIADGLDGYAKLGPQDDTEQTEPINLVHREEGMEKLVLSGIFSGLPLAILIAYLSVSLFTPFYQPIGICLLASNATAWITKERRVRKLLNHIRLPSNLIMYFHSLMNGTSTFLFFALIILYFSL